MREKKRTRRGRAKSAKQYEHSRSLSKKFSEQYLENVDISSYNEVIILNKKIEALKKSNQQECLLLTKEQNREMELTKELADLHI